jgi:hypothetical protein
VNLYAYAGSNPVAFSDPFGLWVSFRSSELARLVRSVMASGKSATFQRMFNALHSAPAWQLTLHVDRCGGPNTPGCTHGQAAEKAMESGGSFYNDQNYINQGLVQIREASPETETIMLIHEFVEAAVNMRHRVSDKKTGIKCGKGESFSDCVVRYEGIIRDDLGLPPRTEPHR